MLYLIHCLSNSYRGRARLLVGPVIAGGNCALHLICPTSSVEIRSIEALLLQAADSNEACCLYLGIDVYLLWRFAFMAVAGL